MNSQALYKLSYGVFLVCSVKGDKINGQIANTVIQVASEPPTLAVSINKSNLTWEFIKESRVFAVSVLSQDTPLSFIGHFGFKSGRDIDKLDGIDYKIGQAKAPIVIDNSVSFLEVKVIGEMDVGTHTIFVGEVVDCYINEDCMIDNKPNIKKINPILYSTYDMKYWKVGEFLAQAFKVGREYKIEK